MLRSYADNGLMSGDLLALEDEHAGGEPLLRPIMRAGQRLPGLETLEQARDRCRIELTRLPPALRELEVAQTLYPVAVSAALRALADSVDQQQAAGTAV